MTRLRLLERERREVDDDGDDDIDDLAYKLRLHRVAADLNEGDEQRGKDRTDRVRCGEQRHGDAVESGGQQLLEQGVLAVSG